jgi:type II secretory pathway pseudopilin PulG
MNGSIDRRRSGFTLLEVIVLISVSSLLMTIVGIWLHKLLLFSNTMLERQRDHVGLQRMSAEMRLDVQLARSWSFISPDELELVMVDDSIIRYRLVSEPDVTKLEVLYPLASKTTEDSTKPGQAVQRRETYRFTPNWKLTWDKAGFPEELTLAVYRLPMLAHPLTPAPSTTSSPAAKPTPVEQPTDNSPLAESVSGKPVEAILRLKINRWNGLVDRRTEDSR